MVLTYLKSLSWEHGQSSHRLMEPRLQKHSWSMIMVSQAGWRHRSLGRFGTENVNKLFFSLNMYNVVGLQSCVELPIMLRQAPSFKLKNCHLSAINNRMFCHNFMKTLQYKRTLKYDNAAKAFKDTGYWGIQTGCLVSFVQLIGSHVMFSECNAKLSSSCDMR